MTNSGSSKPQGGAGKPMRIVVVGGGLVGTLAASFIAKRGHDVCVYELRDDIRKLEHVPGRSINLALSLRGIEALKRLGIADDLLKNHAIPMYARMIHGVDSTKRPIPYGKKNECINSVSRRTLNEVLLTEAEKYPNVTVRFNQKMTGGKLEEGEASFLNTVTGEVINEKADLIIGCDGAYSVVRRLMMRRPLFDFSQEYIEHGYLELYIPPSEEAQKEMELNYLHIWPRKRYMMIALPNFDRSWTVTLFMPLDVFDGLNNPDKLVEFFQENFPDALPLIGEKGLVQSFFRSKPSHLLCVKCKPYHVGNKTVILGDAAHAMVPFYGQGMNCGMEDCIILDDLMTKFNEDLSQVLPAYTEFRHPDAVAICDLALYNYIEMRELVNSKTFLLRKKLDNVLNYLMPNTWVPLYTTVTFSRERYHQCIENRKWQDKVLKRLVLALGMGTMALASLPLILKPDIWQSLLTGA